MIHPVSLSKPEARRYLLRAQLLAGPKLPPGPGSVHRVLMRLRAVQVDSIDVAGASQEIALNSRIEGFQPAGLGAALYADRAGFEYWLKCLCILPVESLPYQAVRMAHAAAWHAAELADHAETVRAIFKQIGANGPQCAADFVDGRRTNRGWRGNDRLVKRLLELLWDSGRLAIARRRRRVRFYDLAERCYPPHSPRSQAEYERHTVLDLCRAMGIIGVAGGSSDVWHNVRAHRHAALREMTADGAVFPISIEGSARPYFALSEDRALLDDARPLDPVTRLLAPLDTALWDRRLVDDVFGFYRAFEVYKPVEQRLYGYYCLPILHGERLVGRCDLSRSADRAALRVIGVFWENGVPPTPELTSGLAAALRDHARFLGLEGVELPEARSD
ncbi:MAG TPA: crosslink repair DNA glycosylase YcaQ family protein [Armatimonadota bacterium]